MSPASALFAVLERTAKSSPGDLNLSACQQPSATDVECKNLSPAIASVSFVTYPSLLTSNGDEDIVWTQDAGDFLGYATGAAPDAEVWDWFADVHRGISCRFSPAASSSSRNQLSRMRAACSACTAACTAFDRRVFA